MPALSRIDYVISQIRMGRRAHIAIGEARDNNKMKLKIVMEPADAGPISDILAATLIALLNGIRSSCQSYIVTDRGHGYSSGKAEISFWMSERNDHEEILLPPPAPPSLPLPGEHPPFILNPTAPEFVPSPSEEQEESVIRGQDSMQEQSAAIITASSPLSSMAANLEGMLASSCSDLDGIRQQLADIEERNMASDSNIAFAIATASSTHSAAPSVAGSGAEASGAEQHATPTSPYNAAYLERLSKAGVSKDDKAMNLFLNKHGDSKSVSGSLQGVERYFHDRLDITSAFLAQQVGLPAQYGASWDVLKSAILCTLEEEEFKSSTSISLGYILHHISKQSPPPSPEKVHRKARRKK